MAVPSEIPVLVAESDAVGRASVRRLLREFQFTDVTYLEDGPAVERLGRQGRYGLIILSTSLTPGDAYKILFLIRADGRNVDTPVLFLHAEGEREIGRKARIAGASGVLEKPLGEEALRSLIEKTLGIEIVTRTEAQESLRRERARRAAEGAEEGVVSPASASAEAGRERLEAGDLDGAEAAVAAALAAGGETGGETVELLFDMAEVLLARGEGERAEGFLRRAEALAPGARGRFVRREQKFLRRGNRKLMARRCRDAKNEFAGAVTANARSVEGHFGLGESYQCLGDPEAGEKAFDRALAIDERPESLHVYNRMGIAARKRKEYDKAMRAYERALSFDPRDPVLLYNKAMVFLAQKLYKSALAVLKEAVEIDPGFGQAKRARRIIVDAVNSRVHKGPRRVLLSREETRVRGRGPAAPGPDAEPSAGKGH